MIIIRFYLETNIDEILGLSDLSNVPTAFLTEIQQDQVYETIFQELQKKLPRRNPQKSPPSLLFVPEDEQRKTLSPHLLARVLFRNYNISRWSRESNTFTILIQF